MGKASNDLGLDAALDWFADCDRIFVCSAQPTNYTEASSTYTLADVTVTAGDGNGDFVIANGDTSGRKLTTGAQSSVLIDTSGTATHVTLCKSGDTTLRYVTTCTSQALTANGSNTLNTPAWDIEIADPS
jgi:hypothetical protein